MDPAMVAALGATLGFAGGDVFTALLARRVSGRASMFLLTTLKLLLYVPYIILWRTEFRAIDGQELAWIVLLGVLFTAAYLGFNMALQIGKNPAMVGVVAGCFPASASLVAIVFLGQRPSMLTIVLLLTVLIGVICIGLPAGWRTSLKVDAGILLALVPLFAWGIFGALLHEPVHLLGTPHAWFVVQASVAIIMTICVTLLYNSRISGLVRDTTKKAAWKLALPAAVIIGVAEALQAFSLSSGREIVIVEALLGSYPAAYFLIAHKIFHEPLSIRQYLGVVVVIIAIVSLSVTAV
jgi:drug/metabolite transporter (DMT)-like permease